MCNICNDNENNDNKNNESVENINKLDKSLYSILKSSLVDDNFGDDNKEDKLFYDYLINILNIHHEKSIKNKNSYFNKNSQNAKSKQSIDTFQKTFSSIKKIAALLNLIFSSAICILQYRVFKYTNSWWINILIGILIFIFISILIWGNYYIANLSLRLKDLKLRAHCETWVRHEYMYECIKIEIMCYISLVGKYSNKSSNEAKLLFKATILDLYKQNMDKFDSNMKKAQEAIE